MNKNLPLLIGALALLIVGYFIFVNKQAVETPVEVPDVIPAAETLILSEQNESGEMGIAVLTEEDGKVKVRIEMVGEPDNAAQPAHIHIGKCPDVGAVKYPLTNLVDGDSETILDVSMEQLKAQMPLAINVHKSVAESGVYVSCGNLEF